MKLYNRGSIMSVSTILTGVSDSLDILIFSAIIGGEGYLLYYAHHLNLKVMSLDIDI